MNRESIHITFSESLRRANVQPRLAALAEQTGMPPAQIAGQAMKVGIALLERDWRLVLPGADLSSLTALIDPAQQPARSAAAGPVEPTPRPAAPVDAVPAVLSHPAATHEAPADVVTRPKAPRARVTTRGDQTQRSTAPDTAAPSGPPSDNPKGATTREAAHALGYNTEAAFRQHCTRHRELLACSTKSGRDRLWDLDRLRAEYRRLGFAPKGQPLDEQQADQLGPAEAPTT